jgi:hypothetical protein
MTGWTTVNLPLQVLLVEDGDAAELFLNETRQGGYEVQFN